MKTLISTILICLTIIFQAQTIQTDTWMYNMNKVIGNKPLNKIILPGAYRSGLDRITAGTAVPENCSTQSQDTNVYGLLNRGARYIDLQLICWRDNAWYLGSYNYSFLFGMQMAVGQSLDGALEQVVKFLTEKKHNGEIVILHISGYADSKKNNTPSTIYGEMDALKKEALLTKISSKLSVCLYKEANALNATVNEALASVHKTQKEKSGAAIVLFNDTKEPVTKHAGIFRTDDCKSSAEIKINSFYKKTDSIYVLNKQLPVWEKSVMVDCYSVSQWVLTWRSTDNRCNRQLAQIANTNLDIYLKSNLSTHPQAICLYFFNQNVARQIINLNNKL